MAVNKRRISMREGSVYIGGRKIADAVKCEIKFTPEISEGRAIGERGKSRRYIGYDVTGTITEYKTTPWLRDIALNYQNTGETPELTIQGIEYDPNSDYYDSYGSNTITCAGCVLTGDMTLLSLDSEGELAQTEVEFAAHHIV